MLKVDGTLIEKNQDGKYFVTVKHSVQSVNISVTAEDSLSTVKIGDKDEALGSSVEDIDLTGDKTKIEVVIIAEDGTEKTEIVEIQRLSDNTAITTLKVDGHEILPDENGKYIYKLNKQESAELYVKLEDGNATVKVGEATEKGELTQEVDLDKNLDNIEIPVIVIAEDGTERPYTLVIVRASKDNSIFAIEIAGVLEEDINQTSEKTYTARVINTNTSAEVKVTTTDDLAKVKIGNNALETHVTEKTVSIPTDSTDVVITVVAENGDVATYTLTILKVYDLGIADIKVNNMPTYVNGKTYEVKVENASDKGTIVITPNDGSVKVQIGEEIKTGTSTFEVDLDGDTTEVNVTILSPNGEDTKSYTLVIKKKSTDVKLLKVAVDSKIANYDEQNKKYQISVVDKEKYILELETNNSLAKVEVISSILNKEATNTLTEEFTLETENQITLQIKVTSENGDVELYTLDINKVSDNNKLKVVKVNDTEVEEIDGVYTYWAGVSVSDAEIYIETEHAKAKIKVADYTEVTNKFTKTESITDGSLILNVVVTAENGDISNYTIRVIKKSIEAGIEKVFVNGKESITIIDNSKYYSQVKVNSDADTVAVTVNAINEYAEIKINNDAANITTGTNTIDVTLGSEKTTVVPIQIKAQDGVTVVDATLEIERIYTDATLGSIKVNNNPVIDYNEDTKTYSIYVAKNAPSGVIVVEANNDYAKVKIDTEDAKDKTATLTKELSTDETRLPIVIIAEDGSSETYYLEIIKYSDNAGIDLVEVDGIEIIPNGNGSYSAKVSDTKEDVAVHVVASNKYADFMINSNIENIRKIENTEVVELTGKVTVVPIKVTASDGTVNDVTLTIEKVSNNTKLEYVKVGGKTILEGLGNTYLAFVDREIDSTEISIKAENIYAKVQHEDNTPANVITIQQTITEEITEIVFTVISEGTETTLYKLYLVKKSNDNTLDYITVNGLPADITEDGNYLVKVDVDVEIADIVAVTGNIFASLKFVDDEEFTLKQIEKTITLDNGKVTTVTITVKAQDGTEQDYTLLIEREYDINDIDIVKVEGTEIEDFNSKTNTYIAFIERDVEDTEIYVKALNEYATVSILGESAKGELTVDVEIGLNEESKDITILVTSEKGNVKTYTLKLMRLSNNAKAKKLEVNGVEITPNVLDETKYEVNILNTMNLAQIKVTAENEYASIEVDNKLAQIGVNTTSVGLSSNEIITVPVTVTAQDGTIKEYTIIFKRLSGNSEIGTLKVNDEVIEADDNRIYKVDVDYDDKEVDLEVILKHENAKVKVLGEEEYKEITKTITLDTTKQLTTVQILVTAEDNTSTTYVLNIMRISKDNTLKIVKVDDVTIELSPDGKYHVTIPENIESVKVFAETTNSYAIVSILDEAGKSSSSGRTIQIEEGKVTSVPIIVVAQDGTPKEYILEIEKISNDNNIKLAKLNGIIITTFDEATNTYSANIAKKATTAELYIKTESDFANINLLGTDATSYITKELTNLSLDEDVITTTITITSEQGQPKVYKLKLIRLSDDTELSQVKVNNDVIVKDVTAGTKYYVDISKYSGETEITVTAESDYAIVGINGELGQTKTTSAIITIEDGVEEITVPVKVIAQDGTLKDYSIIFKKLSDDTTLDRLKVDNNVITKNEQDEYNVTVVSTKESVDLSILLKEAVAKVKVQDLEKKASLNKEITLDEPGTTTTVEILVTAENGTEKTYTLNIYRKDETEVTGKVITANTAGKHIATITVYRTGELGVGNDALIVPIKQISTNEDGTFEIDLPVGTFDIVITKPGYLKHTITGIVTTKDEPVELEEKTLIAGDVTGNGVIDIDDLVKLNDYFGVTSTHVAYDEKYDFNGDGKVDTLDRNMLKANYGKAAIVEIWVAPVIAPAMIEIDVGVHNWTQGANMRPYDDNLAKNQQTFILPTTTAYVITSEYGMRTHPTTGEQKMHTGIDIVPEHNSNIVSVADGVVTYAGVLGGYGNAIEIKHIIDGNPVYSFYGHLSEINVSVGQSVVQGEVLGKEGGATTDPNPGTSTGHHLHFEIRTGSGSGHSVNPRDYIKF